MSEINRPLKVFLSYASQDKPSVRELSRRLVGEGWIETWQDEKNLLPGQDWRVKIEEAVEEADVVIIVLSQNSVTKEGHVQKELRYAREIALEKPEDTIFLIPLRLDECDVPRGLRFYQWVDYFGERKNDGYASLVESLQLRYEQKLKQDEESFARQEEIRKEREAAEKIAREKAEKEAAEKARLEARKLVKQKAAKEKAEREAARKQAEKEAAVKVRLEEEEQARQKAAQEKKEREAAEKAVREKVEREAAEKTRLEAEELLKQKAAKEKAEHEKAEKKAAEKAWFEKTWSEAEEREKQKVAQDKKEREAAEKTARERAMRESAEKAKHEKEKREASKEEKSDRKSGKLEAPKPESHSRQSDSGAQPLFWIVGLVGLIFMIWLSTLNRYPEAQENIQVTTTPYLVYPSTQTALPVVFPTNTSRQNSTPTQIVTASPVPLSIESSVVSDDISGSSQKLYFASGDGYLNELDISSGKNRRLVSLVGYRPLTSFNNASLDASLFWLNSFEIVSFPFSYYDDPNYIQIINIKTSQVKTVERDESFRYYSSSDLSKSSQLLLTHHIAGQDASISLTSIDENGHLSSLNSGLGFDLGGYQGPWCIRWNPIKDMVAIKISKVENSLLPYSSLAILRIGAGEKPIVIRKQVDGCISWSPDGEYIAFANSSDAANSNNYQKGVYYIEYASGTVVELTDTLGYLPVWSPDGNTIAFITESGISKIDINTKVESQIYAGNVLDLLWGK